MEVHQVELHAGHSLRSLQMRPPHMRTTLPLALMPAGAPRPGQRGICILSVAMCCPERREDAAAHVRHIYEASKPGMSTSQARQLHSRLETMINFIKVYPAR